MQLIIVSGLSGSGKSIALQTLEDLDCYCVDNLPMNLLPAFMRSIPEPKPPHAQTIAVGIDARNSRDNIGHFREIVEELRAAGVDVRILFLRCSDETLLRRYSETRRRHPLSTDELPLVEAVRRERQLMVPVAELADLAIDTTRSNVHQLRQQVRSRLFGESLQAMSLLFCSFGYKYGIPADADFVFDVRCLPNPHWIPTLREYTGRDPAVVAFLREHREVDTLLGDIRRFLETWLAPFEASGRSYLTVAIGCTGGQHRSVYAADQLAQAFGSQRRRVTVRHRELE